jgi:type III secretory pathway component EscU
MSNENPEQPKSQDEALWQAEPVVAVGTPGMVVSQPTSSNSIVALVLSIMSWVVCPVIFAIVALVFANKADKEITANQGNMGGGSLVLASKIVSWINIGFYAALLVLGLLAFFFVALVGVASN